MKYIPPLVCSGLLLLSLTFTACTASGSGLKTGPVFTVTPYPNSPAKSIPVTIEPTKDDAEGDISFLSLSAEKSLPYGEQYIASLKNYQKGDMVITFAGKIRNDSSSRCHVLLDLRGYDSFQNETSWTLDSVDRVDMGPEQTRYFVLSVSDSENTTYYRLQSQKLIP